MESVKMFNLLENESAPITRHVYWPIDNIVTIVSASDKLIASDGKFNKIYAAIMCIKSNYEWNFVDDVICVSCRESYACWISIKDPLRLPLCRDCIHFISTFARKIESSEDDKYTMHIRDSKKSTAVLQVIGDKTRTWVFRKLKVDWLKSYYVSSLAETTSDIQCGICYVHPALSLCLNCHKMMAKIYARDCVIWWYLKQLEKIDDNLLDDVIGYIAHFVIELIIHPVCQL